VGVLDVRALVVCVFALPACYSPSLRDCTVSCASASDCASGQVCASGLCTSPDTGTCERVDAGVHDAAAASHIDAAVIDAPPTVIVHVQIDGKGTVVLDNYGACSSQNGQNGNCSFTVTAHAAQTIRVSLLPPGDPFVGWTSMTCKTAGAVCSFTPSGPTTIVGKFDKNGGPK